MLVAEELSSFTCTLANFIGNEQDVVFLAEIVNNYLKSARGFRD
jgi:hypothetical protein